MTSTSTSSMTSAKTSASTPCLASRRLRAYAALILCLSGAGAAQAEGFFCGQGKIDLMLLPSNGQSNIRIHLAAPTSPENLWRYRSDPGLPPLISMWEDNPARWSKKMAALELAFSMNQPVRISSSDNNCMGPQDEFEIAVCATDKACPLQSR